jgi:hypothetical protein
VYKTVNPSCIVYHHPPHCGRVLALRKLVCECGQEILYDGTNVGLFLYSSATCMSLQILYGYARSLITDGRAMSACWNDMDVQYQEHNLVASARNMGVHVLRFCSQPHFRAIIYAWLDRLSLPYTFSCTVCKDDPEVLIGDATSQSMQAHHYVGDPITTTASTSTAPRPSKRAGRSFIKQSRHQKAMSTFVTYIRTPANTTRYSDDASKWQSLLEVAGRYGLKELLTLADAVHCLAGLSNTRQALVPMLLCLVSDSPVLSYMPLAVVENLHSSALQGFDPSLVNLLRNKAPVFLGFCVALEGLYPSESSAPFGVIMQTHHGALLDRLKSLAMVSCTGGPEEVRVEGSAAPSCTSRECLSSGACIGVPQYRQRALYHLDSDSKEDGGCNHRFISGSHGSKRTGGIFTWFCKHGVCYGFYVIPGAEGRNDAFSFLYKYFKRAPRVVVYDFACSLQDYCLNRQPEHFKHTSFLIDRFHWFNHATCARSYNLSLYPEYDDLNTQVAEQGNSHLNRVRGSVSQMRQDNFMRCLWFYLAMWNVDKLKKLSVAYEAAAMYLQ